MAALFLGEALLRAVARPAALDHARAETSGDGLRAVGRAGVDHDDVIAEVADRGYGTADAIGLVARDDEDRKRWHGRRVSDERLGPVG